MSAKSHGSMLDGRARVAIIAFMKPHPFQITDPDELKLSEEVVRRIRQLSATNDRYDDLRGALPLPSSQLAADDRGLDWLQLSLQIRSYMNLAADMIGALDRLVFVDGEFYLPIHAHYPLLRSVIEASAQAVWILTPEEHPERVSRSLRARRTEQKWDDDLLRSAIETGRSYGQIAESDLIEGAVIAERAAEDRMRKLRELSDAAGLQWGTTASGLPSTSTILSQVGGVGDIPGAFAESVWRLISGLTHPSASRATFFSSTEILEDDGGQILNARVSASLGWTRSAVLVALTLFTKAVQLYRIRRTKPHRETDA